MDDSQSILHMMDRWPCCNLATCKITELPQRERSFFESFIPEAVSAIALGHHVTAEDDWRWYATANGGQRCASDDHLREVCESIRGVLLSLGHDAELVSYPGESGLQFRYVAEAAGFGTIGTNAFLFHPVWGPWVHLRVLATTATLNIRPRLSGDQLCNRCNLCISECPAGAISKTTFEGLQCRSYRKSRGEYEPYGPLGELRYCKRCISICPMGQ